jgi:hypothetical protein
MKYLLIFSVFLISLNLTYQITSLMVNLGPQEEQCLHEYFSDKTLVIYEIFANITDINIKITDPEEKVLYEKSNEPNFKQAFTTYVGGYFECCFWNRHHTEVGQFTFSLRHGVAAKDYSSVAKTKDLKPLELDVSVIN